MQNIVIRINAFTKKLSLSVLLFGCFLASGIPQLVQLSCWLSFSVWQYKQGINSFVIAKLFLIEKSVDGKVEANALAIVSALK